MKLICFSHAGGSAEFFSELRRLLIPAGIEVITSEYAGHGKKMGTKAYRHFDELVCDMIDNIMAIVDETEEYALLGYSMGSVVLSEVVRNMHSKLPSKIFIAAHGPKIIHNVDWNEVSDEYLRDRITDFGGIADKLKNNQVYWRMYGPIYRNDFRMLDEVTFLRKVIAHDIPAIIMYSPEDDLCENIEDWNYYFTYKNCYFKFDGGHFFINDKWEIVANIIKENI
ncbi:MAG: thioesterase domain-containing protein [Lachnospiraceae bacterium]|nr:thioesterase domain-containing protein [Lachnospiraceae bacterium]